MNEAPDNDKPDSDPGSFHHREGLRLAAAGQMTEALNHFRAALQLRPENPVWQFNYGLACQHLKNLPNAIAAYRNAVRLKADFFDAWNNLSAALKAAGEAQAAISAGLQAVKLSPNAGGAHLNLGNALKASGDWAAAEAAYRRALILDPGNPRVRLNLGNTLRELGRLPEAIALLRQAVEKSPNFPEAHRDLAFALMLSGDLGAGWIENEWRWQTEEMVKKRRSFDAPAWAGENLAGRSILVYTEQGFGDAIQFARYVELLAQRGARVIVECQPALARLFATLRGVSEVIARGEPLPRVEFQLALLSLPRIFGTTLECIPDQVPYLRPPECAAEELPPISGSACKVGLVWAGNPEHLNDQNRSISLPLLAPLLQIEHARFYSLQVGDKVSELKRERWTERVVDLGPHLRDFAATAAAIQQLDLVISVDTSVAHLAGALRKPVWLLLPFAPDWRWLLGRDDSPWYPTARLFRQDRIGEWSGVVERLYSELSALRR